MLTILVTGDRNWTDRAKILWELAHWEEKFRSQGVRFIHGGARGADTIAHEICHEEGWDYEVFYADWEKYGRSAGPIRNRQMLIHLRTRLGHKLAIAFHPDLDKSKGTKNMVGQVLKAGLPVRLIC